MGVTIGKCVIDIYNGEAYDKAKHTVPSIYWSDGRFYYWGWIYDANDKDKVVGDFTAESVQAASAALGVEFN